MATSSAGPSNKMPNSAQSRTQAIITHSISGVAPGLLNPSQPTHLLRHPTHKLFFASFHPLTATTPSDISDPRMLSLQKELCRPQRVVIETTAGGDSFWRFVPNANREDGCVDEGTWPRVVEICGELVECSLDQWEIYKLDPEYECLVRMPPNRSAISRVWAPEDGQQEPQPTAQPPPQHVSPKVSTNPALNRPRISKSTSPSFPVDNRRHKPDAEPTGTSSSTTSALGNSQAKGKDKTAGEVEYMILDDRPPHNHTPSAAPSYPRPRTKVGYQGEQALAPTRDSRYHIPNDGMYLCAACLYLIGCVVVACWMLASGPKLVPHQDTRITNVVLSVASKVALGLALWIVTLGLHAQWAGILVSGRRVRLRGLLEACGGGGSLSRVRYIRTAPTVGVGCTAVIGAAVTLLMTLTSAGFKYVILPGTAVQEFSGPNFQAICNYSLVDASTGYFCTGLANTVTVDTEWSYLDIVNSGAGGNVLLTGGHTGTMSANVTLTSAPAVLRMTTDAAPPWAAVDVSCRAAELLLEFVGNGSTSSNIVYVDGRQLDQLSIAEMPSWGSQVQLYQQINDSGPYSSLSPWYMVLLARDLNDGTANIGGLSGDAVSYLGNSFVDLHGEGPTLQGILGAAAYCNFSGSTGGNWPSGSWPAISTTNVVVGTGPNNGTIDLSTVFLNYGPSWQYSPVSANSLLGGSVSYIANWTVEANNFADYIAMFMRNQWALMMYTNNYIGGYVTNTTYNVRTQPQLYIQATVVVLLPVAALALCICCAAVCVWTMLGLGVWYECVDVAPWWLLKATGSAWPGLEGYNASKPEFDAWCNQMQCMYSVEAPDTSAGCLTLESTATQGEGYINPSMQ